MFMKAQTIPEADVQVEILEGLNARRIGFFWRCNNAGIFDAKKGVYRRPSKFSIKGVSDILGVLNGKSIAIEVKSKDEYTWVMNFLERVEKVGVLKYLPTSAKEDHVFNQILFLYTLRKNGGIGFFTYSLEHTLGELKEAFDED